MEVISLIPNDASSEITNFQRVLKMKILNFIFYMIDHCVCDQLLLYLK